ncbi:MAG: bL35 family ribosomal protein [Candidatus Gracilibacteria bacterium]
MGKVGKQKTHSGAKKRTDRTGTGKIRMEKAAHRHRLSQKSSRQKNLGGGKTAIHKSDEGRLNALLQL